MEIKKDKKFDLEERLIEFSLTIIDITEALPNTRAGIYLAGQLVRSGMSPALNYGEAQVAESRSDFVHKMKICLKELKESNVALQIITRKEMLKDMGPASKATKECQELISIFVKSIETARKNR